MDPTKKLIDLEGLTHAMGKKADKAHTHAQSDVTGLSDALAGKASKTHSHAQTEVTGLTEALDGKAAADLSNVPNEKFAEKASAAGAGGITIVNATSTNGVDYTATANGVTTLENGMLVVIIPNIVSKSTSVTLNLNGLGAKYIRQSVSAQSATAVTPGNANWLTANKPLLLMYDGVQWRTVGTRATAADLYGTLAIEKGGTGATTAAQARTNLSVYSKEEVDKAIQDAIGVAIGGSY